MLLRSFTKWKLQVNIHKTEAILFTRRRPNAPAPLHFQHTIVPWKSHVRYLGLSLDSKLLFTKHITSVTHKATGTFLQLFSLLARDSTLTIPNKLTLYKLFIRSVLTYAATVWSYTSPSNYRRLHVMQSKCLRVIGNYPRCTPIPCLHTTLNITPISDFKRLSWYVIILLCQIIYEALETQILLIKYCDNLSMSNNLYEARETNIVLIVLYIL
jgi:hypothetical protein